MNRNPSTTLTREHDAPELDDEDRRDLEEGLAALGEFLESGEAAVPLDEVKRRLGLR